MKYFIYTYLLVLIHNRWPLLKAFISKVWNTSCRPRGGKGGVASGKLYKGHKSQGSQRHDDCLTQVTGIDMNNLALIDEKNDKFICSADVRVQTDRKQRQTNGLETVFTWGIKRLWLFVRVLYVKVNSFWTHLSSSVVHSPLSSICSC